MINQIAQVASHQPLKYNQLLNPYEVRPEFPNFRIAKDSSRTRFAGPNFFPQSEVSIKYQICLQLFSHITHLLFIHLQTFTILRNL